MIYTATAATSPGTIANDDQDGDIAWTNPSNAAASDNAYATVALGTGEYSNLLKCSNFGFNIPNEALVIGIKVEIEHKDNASGDPYVANIGLGGLHSLLDDVFDATTKPGAADAYSTFGGVFWTGVGFSNGGPSTAILGEYVNSSDFYVTVQYANDTATTTVSVDHVRVTLYYTLDFKVQVTGWKFPGTIAEFAATSNPGQAWSNLANLGASDGSYGTVTLNSQESRYIKASNFGFNIPAGAIIIGAHFRTEHKSDGAGDLGVNRAGLLIENDLGDANISNMMSTNNVTRTDGLSSFTSDVFFHEFVSNIGQLSPGFVNASGFGYGIQYIESGVASGVVSVDSIQANIYYIARRVDATSSVGPVSPSTVASVDEGALAAWTNPTNAASSNDSYATVTTVVATEIFTDTLLATGFDFSSVPDDALITGVKLEVEQKFDVANANILPEWQLRWDTDNLIFIEDEFVPGATAGTSDAYSSVGGVDNLLGNKPFTGKELKSTMFGVALRYRHNNGDTTNRTISVDHIRMTVYYAQPKTQRKSPGTLANQDTGGTDWTNPSNAAASDDSRAVATNIPADGGSDVLAMSNFSFAIPTGARIIGFGIRAEVQATNALAGIFCYLSNNIPTPASATKITGTAPFLVSFSSKVGSDRYQWTYVPNIPSNGMLPEDVNSSNFGIVCLAQNFDVSAQSVSIDHVDLMVFYQHKNSMILAAVL